MLKLYTHHKGFIITGKAWEIKAKLSEYGRIHTTVQQLVSHQQTILKKLNKDND